MIVIKHIYTENKYLQQLLNQKDKAHVNITSTSICKQGSKQNNMPHNFTLTMLLNEY